MFEIILIVALWVFIFCVGSLTINLAELFAHAIAKKSYTYATGLCLLGAATSGAYIGWYILVGGWS